MPTPTFPEDHAPRTPPRGKLNVVSTRELTGQQAMQFQPSNSALIAGVVGTFDYGNGRYGYGNPALWSQYTINGLPIAWPGAYAYYRKVLQDPSVRFVRSLAYSPILITKWNYQADSDAPEGAVELLAKLLDPMRMQILDDAVRAMDYGWVGFEQCFAQGTIGGLGEVFYPTKLKSFMPDLTAIYVDIETGDFTAFNNNSVVIPARKSVLWTYDGESGNYYGRGRCQNLLQVMPEWQDAADGAARYDRKIAGVFLICHYPPGQSIDRNGKLTENWQIAQDILDRISAGTPIAVCNEFAGEILNEYLDGAAKSDRTRWKIEMLEDHGSRQPGFIERLVYLDKQKARAYLVPERAAFEAQRAGSKADSESQSDIVLINATIAHQSFLSVLNGGYTNPNSFVNNILRMNYGDKAIGTVRIVPQEMEEHTRGFYREIVKSLLLQCPEALVKLSDAQELFNRSGLPAPSEPATPEDVTVILEDMVVRQQSKGNQEAKQGASETLAKIHEGLRIKLSREKTKTQQ